MIKITKIYISSFGKLKDFSCTLKDGLNVIHEKNGFGKTTVAGFIKAMFFGLNSSNPRNIEANTRKRYTPWESTEKFGGYLCFETKGKSYRIERYFGKTPAQDTFMLYDENEVPCEDFGDNPGQALFDIDADAFERCMYIPQSGITVSPNDSFISKLNKLVENSDDDSNFQAAYKKLDELRKSLSSTSRLKNVSTKSSIEREIVETEEALNDARRKKREIERRKAVVAENENKARDVMREKEKYLELQKSFESQQALKGKAEVLLRLQSEVKQKELELEKFAQKNANVGDDYVLSAQRKVEANADLEKKLMLAEERAAATKKDKKVSFPLLIFALLFLVAGAAAYVFKSSLPTDFGFIGAGVCAVAAVLCLIFAFSKRKNKKQISKEAELNVLRDEYQKSCDELKSIFLSHGIEENNFFAAVAVLKKIKADYVKAQSDYAAAKAEFSQKSSDPDYADVMSRIDANAVDYTKQINDCTTMLSYLATQNAKIEGETAAFLSCYDEESEALSKMEVLKESYNEVLNKISIVEKTMACLAEAKKELSKSYMPKIKQGLSQYLKRLSGGEFANAAVDDGFGLYIEEKNSLRDFGFFSRGISDLGVFCLRLALIDTMYPEEKPPLILDDPFVNFDRKKYEEVSALLKERAKNCQILYFTCRLAD